MNSAPVARLTAGMNLADIQREMQKLGNFRTPPSQHHTMENGVEVIYVKKSGPKDQLKRLLMSVEMRADQGRPLVNLILSACEKIGVNKSDAGFQNIREALIHGNGDFYGEMNNLVARESLAKYVRNHGF